MKEIGNMIEIKFTGKSYSDLADQMQQFLFTESSTPDKPEKVELQSLSHHAPAPTPIAKAAKATKPARTKKEVIAQADGTEVELEEISAIDVLEVKAATGKEYTEVDTRAAAGKVLSHFSSKGEDGIAPLQKLLKAFNVMKAVEVPADSRYDFIHACEKACT